MLDYSVITLRMGGCLRVIDVITLPYNVDPGVLKLEYYGLAFVRVLNRGA